MELPYFSMRYCGKIDVSEMSLQEFREEGSKISAIVDSKMLRYAMVIIDVLQQ